MHRIRVALLAAAVTAGLPAMAVAAEPDQQEWQGRQQRDADRAARDANPGGGRPDRGGFERGDRGPGPGPAAAPPAAPQPRADGGQFRGDLGPGPRSAGFDRGQDRPGFDRGQRPDPGRDGRSRADFRNQGNGDRGPRWGDDRGRGGFDPRGGRPGFQSPQYLDGYAGGYDRRPFAGWRDDRRYDWRGFRDGHRDLFRAGRYVAPRGWGYGYRRFTIGFRVPSFFLGTQYWIDDPWSYRLPPVDGPYRWVRYYNDVLLIDLTTGEVVDEIPGFFW